MTRPWLVIVVANVLLIGAAPPVRIDHDPEPVTPAHLRDRPSYLYRRVGDRIEEAPAELLKLAKTYAKMPGKGKTVNGRRITILVNKTRCKVGEPVCVLHVLEAVTKDVELYISGPKPVYDEYVDGKNAHPQPKDAAAIYDGPVPTGPGVDFHYDITTYTFAKAGKHTIQWKGGGHPIEGGKFGLESNVVTITVVE